MEYEMNGQDMRFGILPSVQSGVDYFRYPPNMEYEQRCRYYHCVPIHSDLVMEWSYYVIKLQTYIITIDTPYEGISITNETIIPPESARQFAEIIKPWSNERNVADLIRLLQKAADENKHVISFGV